MIIKLTEHHPAPPPPDANSCHSSWAAAADRLLRLHDEWPRSIQVVARASASRNQPTTDKSPGCRAGLFRRARLFSDGGGRPICQAYGCQQAAAASTMLRRLLVFGRYCFQPGASGRRPSQFKGFVESFSAEIRSDEF